MKRIICLLLVGCFVAGVAIQASALPPIEYGAKYWRDLKEGVSGYDVYAMKVRLRELGYYHKNDIGDKYTYKIADVVKLYQAGNGMMQTGELSLQDLEALHDGSPKPYEKLTKEERMKTATEEPSPTPAPTPTPTPEITPKPTRVPDETPTPTPAPVVASHSTPPLQDEEGYIAKGQEYYREDPDGGQWTYLAENLQIYIKRYEDKSIPLIWFETEIFCRGDQQLGSYENNVERPGVVFKYPETIASNYQLVLGFTDDFFGYRVYNKETIGAIIRNGRVLNRKTMEGDTHFLPNLDVLAQFPDGTLQAFDCMEHTALELQMMGAVNVFCFGPVVLKEGQMGKQVLGGYFERREPRQVLGMICPGHYLLMTVQGRLDETIGTGLQWVAKRMQQRGVVEALNLDGGNTISLVFRGNMINSLGFWKGKKFIRTVSSLIGIGRTEYEPAVTPE